MQRNLLVGCTYMLFRHEYQQLHGKRGCWKEYRCGCSQLHQERLCLLAVPGRAFASPPGLPVILDKRNISAGLCCPIMCCLEARAAAKHPEKELTWTGADESRSPRAESNTLIFWVSPGQGWQLPTGWEPVWIARKVDYVWLPNEDLFTDFPQRRV